VHLNLKKNSHIYQSRTKPAIRAYFQPNACFELNEIFGEKNLKDIPICIRAEEALKKTVTDKIADNKRFGDPIVIWRDEKVVKIPADQIELREDQTGYESK